MGCIDQTAGKDTWKVVPSPGVLWTEMLPSWASTSFFVIAKPRPEDPFSGALDLSARKERLKISGKFSSEMPGFSRPGAVELFFSGS